MKIFISKALDYLSDSLSRRKGLLPLIGILLVLFNLLLQCLPLQGWLIRSNLFLHLGVIIAVLGLMLAWAL
jgi:hypothetical protein